MSFTESSIHMKHLFVRVIPIWCALTGFLFAQNQPVIWGEIPISQLKATAVPGDTNASAAILYDYGESYSDQDHEKFVYKRHTRIKIFSPKGYSFAEHTIVVNKYEDVESMSDVEGFTYALDANGQLKKTKLAKSDVRIKDLDYAHQIVSFTLPALERGCIIEYRYQVNTDDQFSIRDWRFQHSVPTLWSEYRVKVEDAIILNPIAVSTDTFAVWEDKSIEHMHYYHWIMKDIPAFKREPYMSATDDYIDRLIISLKKYSALRIQLAHSMLHGTQIIIGGKDITPLSQWQSHVTYALEDDDTNYTKSGDILIQKTVDSLVVGAITKEQKLEAIYHWLITHFACTNAESKTPSQSLAKTYELKSGSLADLTLFLQKLLDKAGIETQPVFVSSMSHGKIITSEALLSQFNKLILMATVETQKYFLDPSDEFCPYNQVSPELLGVGAMEARVGVPRWHVIGTSNTSSVISLVSAEIDSTGTIKGLVRDNFRQIAAQTVRKASHAFTDKNLAKLAFSSDLDDAYFDSLQVSNKDCLKCPIEISAKFDAPAYAQVSNDLMTFNPHFMHRVMENPFQDTARRTNIRFPYGVNYQYVLSLRLPAGYEVKSMPEEKELSVAFGSLKFSRHTQVEDGLLQLIIKFSITNIDIDRAEYPEIREFYRRVVDYESAPLLLTKRKE
jgi:hypothetical protein